MRRLALFIFLVALVASFAWTLRRGAPTTPQSTAHPEMLPTPEPSTTHNPPPLQASETSPEPTTQAPKFSGAPKIRVLDDQQKQNKKVFSLPITIDADGLAVVQHDMVLGVPTDASVKDGSPAALGPINLWSKRIPYHIQPHLPEPGRVLQAIALFEETVLEFVPYTHQKDAMVFEVGQGNCKSYVGKVGGTQPIWLSAQCSPSDIAHEIMHALGFIHEQNRSDRNDYIDINMDNIDESHSINFVIFPKEFMVLSGRAPFDFTSIMIYPPTMFARGSSLTMHPKDSRQQIQPGNRLSSRDVERINRVYTNR